MQNWQIVALLCVAAAELLIITYVVTGDEASYKTEIIKGTEILYKNRLLNAGAMQAVPIYLLLLVSLYSVFVGGYAGAVIFFLLCFLVYGLMENLERTQNYEH